MPYTVNKLAKLSGVSVRTLRFYDEIGLLKPAYYGDNQYRYYEEAELLMLQQILFFRKLGFQLSDIQRIISSADFDKISTLESHKKILEQNLDQTQQLIETVEKTIAHLRGKQPMKIEEIFHGFDAEKQKLYEKFLVDNGVDENTIDQVRSKVANWGDATWLQHKKEADQLHDQLVLAIKQQLPASSPQVQALIKKHYELTKQFWVPNKDTYIGLSQLYGSHPDFVKFYAELHPSLLSFLTEAMKIFAERELT